MKQTSNHKLYTTSLIPFIFILSILLARYYGGHLLFHSLAEMFSILVGLMMIVIVSYTYQFTKNNFLLYLSIGYFWIAILDILHMLTFPGMSIYIIESSNVTLTFWIAARFLEAFVLFTAVFVNFNTISKYKVFILFALVTLTVYNLAFSTYVPILYDQGSGLTSLKINLEYIIIFILFLTVLIYIKKKKNFDESIYYYIITSIVLTILTEFTLTFYAKVDDSFTMLAHLFKFLSYWMIFLSIIKKSLENPFKFLAHESSTYNSIPFPSILVDSQGVIRQINEATTTFLNLNKNEIINQNNHILFHNQNIKENECEVCQAIKYGKTLLSFSLQKETYTYSFTVNPISMKNLTLGSVQVCIDISQRIKKAIALKQSEEQLKTLVSNLPGMAYRTKNDKDWSMLFISENCNKLTGYEASDFIENEFINFNQIIHVDDREYVWDIVQKALSIRQSYEVEYRITMADGTIKWVWERGVGKFINNELIYLEGIILDNDERKKNEFLLIKNENRFRMLFENSEVSIWNEDMTEVFKSLEKLRKSGVTDIKKYLTENKEQVEKISKKVKVVDVNNATLKLFNANSKEEFFSGINKTFGDDALLVFIDELHAIWENEESFTKEAFFKTLDGSTIHGVVTFQIPKNIENYKNISVNIIDITNLKKVEKELQVVNDRLEQKKQELETIIQESPSPMMIHNEDGEVLLVNKIWETLTGYSHKDIDTIEKWTSLAYGKKMPVIREEIDNLYKLKQKVEEGQYDIITKDGNIITWQFGSAPLGLIDGKRTVISSAMDITELKNKDEMLINQSRQAAMGEMIGMIAHQWRQPISGISMDANNMLLDISLGDFSEAEATKYANNITLQTQHLSHTIDDFRNFFKPDKIISEVNIKETINNTLSIVKDSLANNNIKLEISYDTEKKVHAYPRELMQVFVNIINNSKDAFMLNKSDNPSINIKVYENKKYVNIAIEDNGGGIDADILPKVFNPYFSTKDEKTGTGLGLYMSKMIIEKHLNGVIEVKNKNEGACFTIRLLKN